MMRCCLLLFLGGVLAVAAAQAVYAPAFEYNQQEGRGYYGSYYGYEPHRRRPAPYRPLPYDENRFPPNDPTYAYAPNIPTNYLPNYYNYPARNPTQYQYGSYWYPQGPGPYPNTNPQAWYGHPYRRPY